MAEKVVLMAAGNDGKGINILMIDNFDSFTHNLVDEFEKRGCSVKVYRNNTPMEKIHKVVKEFNPCLIVISPGPSTPKDAGISTEMVKAYTGKVPILGVCLGHQCIIEAFGGKVGKEKETMHGKVSNVEHDGKRLFKGVKQGFQCGRYHSLGGLDVPNELEVTAKTKSGVVMGVRHRKYFVVGLQFHPESILTPEGGKIIENLIKLIGS